MQWNDHGRRALATLLFACAPCVQGCGEGDGNRAQPPAPTSPPAETVSTGKLADEIEAAYSARQAEFASSANTVGMVALFAKPKRCDVSTHMQLASAKAASVRNFVAAAVSLVQRDANASIDVGRPTVTRQLRAFQAKDSAWLTTYAWLDCGMPSVDVYREIAATYDPAVAKTYSAAIARINTK